MARIWNLQTKDRVGGDWPVSTLKLVDLAVTTDNKMLIAIDARGDVKVADIAKRVRELDAAKGVSGTANLWRNRYAWPASAAFLLLLLELLLVPFQRLMEGTLPRVTARSPLLLAERPTGCGQQNRHDNQHPAHIELKYSGFIYVQST